MAKIQTTVDRIYGSRNQKSGRIVIELVNWNYDMPNNRYIATVNDYIKVMVPTEEGEIEGLEQIDTKIISYSKEEIDALFTALGSSLESSEGYTSGLDTLIEQALLYVTQNDACDNGKRLYGTESKDWETITEAQNQINNKQTMKS